MYMFFNYVTRLSTANRYIENIGLYKPTDDWRTSPCEGEAARTSPVLHWDVFQDPYHSCKHTVQVNIPLCDPWASICIYPSMLVYGEYTGTLRKAMVFEVPGHGSLVMVPQMVVNPQVVQLPWAWPAKQRGLWNDIIMGRAGVWLMVVV